MVGEEEELSAPLNAFDDFVFVRFFGFRGQRVAKLIDLRSHAFNRHRSVLNVMNIALRLIETQEKNTLQLKLTNSRTPYSKSTFGY